MKLSMSILLSVSAITFVTVYADTSADDRCTAKRTCRSCIVFDTLCSWCKQDGYFSERCDTRNSLLRNKCSADDIVSPLGNMNILKAVPLSEAGVKSNAYVQLKPQKVSLKLRPHQEIIIPVEFRQAEDYPVDLYYLMDLTYSMRDDKEKLSELGEALAARMNDLTSNFRIGFGSFVDKTVLPYVNTVPEKLLNPCVDGEVCNPPYGFRNHMSLSNKTEQFVREVENANVSANLDDAEGGFDAIMQVLVCNDAINWDQKARKIILFASDSGFHYAGDGKLGGIVLPNDERCHLDEDGYYTESNVYDYPSVSQLNRVIKENKVSLVFAVTANQLMSYAKLSEAIEGAYTSELESDSSNIVHLFEEKYKKISSEVEMKANNVPENVKISFQSICPDGKVGNHMCEGLKIGTNVLFNITLELEGCPEVGSSLSSVITVYPVGINEALKIQLEMICECECEMPGHEERHSEKCSSVGTYECGICSCASGHYGRECECNTADVEEDKHLSLCMAENSTDICSDRGDCTCGVCECWQSDNREEEVSGPQCQCDNFSCDRDENQEMCGGSRRGLCQCSKCDCKPGWTGPVCSCSTSKDACVGSDDQICSGHGICECGQCICEETAEGRYGGTACDDCPSCVGKCGEYRHCVECLAWNQGKLSEEMCDANCSSFVFIAVPNLPEDANKQCSFKDDVGCMCEFAYSFTDDNKPVVRVVGEKQCIEEANIPIILAGFIGVIFLAGLIVLLVIRCLVYVKDKRDYARFKEEVQKTQWGEENNPIYKAATSKFTNPMYGSKVKD